MATDRAPASAERRARAGRRPRRGSTAARRTTRVAAVAGTVVAEERARLAAGASRPRRRRRWPADVVARLDALAAARRRPRPVINATGVIVHTNLGRAPWPQAAIEAAAAAAGDYLLLELDRETGRRGPRFRPAEEHLVALTGAEDALVTNNNAAALALAVGLAGRGGGVVVSRGELVEIGGGVRIPEIVRRAGARLIEVGTTNRTRAADFEAPLAEGRATVVLRVHPSNFRQAGFTEAPDAGGARRRSPTRTARSSSTTSGRGALLDTERFGLAHEPMPRERLAAGADLVTFSGDKLVGGPQAGLIVGRADLVARIRRDPLARAMRPDKVDARRRRRDARAVPGGPGGERDPGLADDRGAGRRAPRRAPRRSPRRLGARGVEVVATERDGRRRVAARRDAAVGRRRDRRRGRPTRVLAALRRGRPSVIGRIEDGRVVLDLRTVDPADDDRRSRRAIARRDRLSR